MIEDVLFDVFMLIDDFVGKKCRVVLNNYWLRFSSRDNMLLVFVDGRWFFEDEGVVLLIVLRDIFVRMLVM